MGYFPLNINGGTRNDYSNILISVYETIVHIVTWCFMIEELEEVSEENIFILLILLWFDV